MGCDIHLHIELSDGEKWYHYNNPSLVRNYALFEKMAGVRGEVSEAIAPPRGLPADASEMTQHLWAFEGGHTPSWLSSVEVRELQKWLVNFLLEIHRDPIFLERDYWGYYCGNGWDAFKGPALYTDFRFVFWFDS